jgi:hypothetical protein
MGSRDGLPALRLLDAREPAPDDDVFVLVIDEHRERRLAGSGLPRRRRSERARLGI